MQLSLRWEGDGFKTLAVSQMWCDAHLVVGRIYKLEPVQPRSVQSHKHQFAFLKEGYDQLPEKYAEQFENAEHLRKWLLIMERYADVEEHQFHDRFDMQKAIALERRVAKLDKTYAIIRPDYDNLTYRVITAKSQSVKEMGPREFQESKQRILERLSLMIGTTPEELTKNAGRAA
jgi:predicted nuclease with TOPRIM domain